MNYDYVTSGGGILASPALSPTALEFSLAVVGQSSIAGHSGVVSWSVHAALFAWHVGGQGGVNLEFSNVSAARPSSSSSSWLLRDTTLHFGVV